MWRFAFYWSSVCFLEYYTTQCIHTMVVNAVTQQVPCKNAKITIHSSIAVNKYMYLLDIIM